MTEMSTIEAPVRRHAVGIVGGGTMGIGIAYVYAAAGWQTTVVEPDDGRARVMQEVIKDTAQHRKRHRHRKWVLWENYSVGSLYNGTSRSAKPLACAPQSHRPDVTAAQSSSSDKSRTAPLSADITSLA